VYARYGASTKRGTNDQVGAFGLGCKSAFTLGQQFVVTAVKDGQRTVALFAGGGDRAGGLAAWLCRIARNTHLNDRSRDRRLRPLDSAADRTAPTGERAALV